MTTIEGGIISTDDENLYDTLRMMRSHGMVRESLNTQTKNDYFEKYPDLNSDFIFAFASHNMRPSEINGLLGLEQLSRLDTNNRLRAQNLEKFLSVLNPNIFKTDFKVKGNSNYALTLVLNEQNMATRDKVEIILQDAGIEFRRGLSGGGNQLRQPYLKGKKGIPQPSFLPNTDHIHHYAWYIGNYPDLESEKIDALGSILNNI